VPPIKHAGKTLHEHEGYRFALSERRGGRWPELGTTRIASGWADSWATARRGWHSAVRRAPDTRSQGAGRPRRHEVLAGDCCRRISSSSYENVTEQLIEAIDACFTEVGRYRELRITATCHRNNVLWTDAGPHFMTWTNA